MEKLESCTLQHATPEEVGIDSNAIKAFIDEINEKKLGLQSFTIVKDDKICSQCFWKPYAADIPHVMFSMSKSVTSTAVGFAVDEGLIHLDDKISKFFPEYKKATTKKNSQLTVRMLLTMHSDKNITVFDEKGHTDWVERYFNASYLAKPDSKFNYISENTFMLSAIVSKVTGMSMIDYLYPRVFEPLGIEKPFWEQDGKGNNAAGWGLYMRSEDLAKFFLLYLHGGKWIDGTQIIPEFWVREATKKQTDTTKDGYADNINGYGYQFWRNQDKKSFRADGLFGQRCFIFPEHNALVVLNSGQSEDYKIMEVFWKHIPPAFKESPLPENKDAVAALNETISNCKVEDLPATPRNKAMEKKVSGRKLTCKTNGYTSLITISVQQMLYNKPGHLSEMKLDFTDDGLNFTWREKNDVNTIKVGMNGEYGKGEMHLQDLHYHTYAKAAWQPDGTLKMWIRPVETAHERRYTFKFSEDGSRAKVLNTTEPAFADLMIYYLTFSGRPIRNKVLRSIIVNAVLIFGMPIIEPTIRGKLK